MSSATAAAIAQKPVPGELKKAIEQNDMKAVGELLARGAEFTEKDGIGRDMLTLAASRGFTEIVALLIDKGADVGIDRNQPMIMAASQGHAETVRLLISRGADVNYGSIISGIKTPLLVFALQNEQTETVRVLLGCGADINATTCGGQVTNGWTPLMYCAAFNAIDAMRLLIDKGADITACNEEGLTALSIAESKKSVEAGRLLKEALRHIEFHVTALRRHQRLNAFVSKPRIIRGLRP